MMSARDILPIVQSLVEIPDVLSGPSRRLFDAIAISCGENNELLEQSILVSGASGAFCKVFCLVEGRDRSEAFIDCGKEITALAFSAGAEGASETNSNNDDNPSIPAMLWIATSARQLFCIPAHSLQTPGVYKAASLSAWSTSLSSRVDRLHCFSCRSLRLGVGLASEQQQPHILVVVASAAAPSSMMEKEVLEWECSALSGLELVDAAVTCALFVAGGDFSTAFQSSLPRRFYGRDDSINDLFTGAMFLGFTDGTVQVSLMMKQQNSYCWTPARLLGWFPDSDPIVAILSPPGGDISQSSTTSSSKCFFWFNSKGDVMIVHHDLGLELLVSSPISRVLQSIAMVPGSFGEVYYFAATTTTSDEDYDDDNGVSYLYVVRSMAWSSTSRSDRFPLPSRQDLSHVIPVCNVQASSADKRLFVGSTTGGSLRYFALNQDACQTIWCCQEHDSVVEQGPLHQYLSRYHHLESSSRLHSLVARLERVDKRQLQQQQSDSSIGLELQRLHRTQVALLQKNKKRRVILRTQEGSCTTTSTLESNADIERSREHNDESLLSTSLHAYMEAKECDDVMFARVAWDGTNQTVNYHGVATSIAPCNNSESGSGFPLDKKVVEQNGFHFYTSVVLAPPAAEHSPTCTLVYIKDADRTVYKG